MHGFKKDPRRTVKYLNKAKELAKNKGDACVLTRNDLNNIERYLTSYDEPNTDSSQGNDIIGDSGSVPSQLDERTVQQTTISSLTSNSK